MTSVKELKEFIDYAEKNRKYASETAKGRRAALKLFEDELNDDEKSSIDLVEERFDRIYQSVFQKNKQNITTSSLETYKGRVRSLIREFKKFGSDPAAFNAWDMTRSRTKGSLDSESTKTKDHSGNKQASKRASDIIEAEVLGDVRGDGMNNNMFSINKMLQIDDDMLEYPFAFTNGVAKLQLPKNINQRDAKRLSDFVGL